MLSEAYAGEDCVVLERPRGTREASTRSTTSSGHTSEDTLVPEVPKKTKKEKKQPRNKPPTTKKVNDRISEHIAQIFADELSGNVKYVNPFDVLGKFVAPLESTEAIHSTITTKTTVHTVTKVVEQTITSKKARSKEERASCANAPMKAKYKLSGSIFSLDDLTAVTALENLVGHFGKVSHMGILDKSYSFFVSKARDAALYFKVHNKVAVVGGDPLCEPERYDSILTEFATYRKSFGWSIAFLGATSEFAAYAHNKKWPTMQFGVERVLNPLTNPVLLETGVGKRTITNSKALLRKNVSLGIYIPNQGSDPCLQSQLIGIYSAWCADRNNKPIVQAYMTVMNPFAMPELMVYIYTRDILTGQPNGFAALRKIVNGYHLDPCIALPGSSRGISELLILSSMALLRAAGVSYLSLGFEPSTELGDISGIPRFAQGLTRTVHRRAYRGLPIGGKQAFFDKFRPDDAQQGDLFLVIPTRGLPSLRHIKALMHTANIDISKLMFENVKKSLTRRSGEEPRNGSNELRPASEDRSKGSSSS